MGSKRAALLRLLGGGTAALLLFGLSGAVPTEFVLVAPAQAVRLVEPAGGFSYVPPPGWHAKSIPGLKYKMCFAPPSNGFSPNIVASEDSSILPLDLYQKASNIGLKRSYTAVRVVSQTSFVTASGLQGLRTAVVGVPSKLHLVQVFYLFPASNTRKLIVVVSWLSADGNKYAGAADSAMKTFKLN